MKSKVLIEILQDLDPSGETEVTAGGGDIFSVEILPAYWDGSLNVLIRDPSKAPYYDVIGMEEIRTGNKIRLNIMGLDDVIFDDQKDEGLYKGVSKRFQELVTQYKQQRDKILKDCDLALFTEFCHTEFSLPKTSNEIVCFFNTYEKIIREAKPDKIPNGKSIKDLAFENWRDLFSCQDDILFIKSREFGKV